uniref:Zinc metalloproteinase YIL108W n=1 Tax=Taenia asiatica TaxID=60517 RepID=A0A0R3W7E0_TAEAS
MVRDLFSINGSWTVHYPLFLLRGTFSCHLGCQPTTVTKTNSILFKTSSKTAPGVFFKALISLDTGLNNISICCPHISYNCAINKVPVDDTRPYVRCIYVAFRGHDGSFQAPPSVPSDSDSACRRFGLAVRLLQTLTAETIFAETGCRRTFVCAGDLPAPSNLQPRVVASPVSVAVWCIQSRIGFQEAQSMSSLRLWECLARELDAIFWEDRGRAKWLAVVSCTEFRPLTSSEIMPTSHEEGPVAWLLLDRVRYTHGQKTSRRLAHVYQIHRRLTSGSISMIADIGIQENIFEDFPGTYWANYTTALGTMLHEIGHCFDLDHNSEGIMRRGGDDLNLVLAFPPPGSSSRTVKVQNGYSFRRLSILQFSGVTFYENALQVTENTQDQSDILWGRCESIEDCGRAFWRKEVAQFLSFHRWFIDSPRTRDEHGTELKDGILESPTGIRLIQIRITEDTSSPNLAKLWNLTRQASVPELPLDASLMQGCIVYHKLFEQPQKRLSITKILQNAFSRLKVPTLKVVVLDCNGYVFQKTASNDHPDK